MTYNPWINDEVLFYWTNKPYHTINKTTFRSIFSKVWPKAVSPKNIMTGFRATGIYPYDLNIIPGTAFAPSGITSRRTMVNENRYTESNLDINHI